VTDTSTLDRARTALAKHAWQEAYEGFSEGAADADLDAEDLARLGEAAWWSAHPAESLAAFERAVAAYEAEGNRRRAAFVALRLAMEYADRAEPVLWNAWHRRALRLMEGEPDCVERGYLELALVRSSIEEGDLEGATRHAVAAQEIGRRFGDDGVRAFGTVLEGGILVFGANVREGLALVDEGTLAAVGGEFNPYAAGNIYCVTLGVCRSLADYPRAARWTEAATRWCEQRSITGFPGVCRVQRAEILRLHGSLEEAESEARRAQTELEAFGRLPQAGAGAYEVGEVRLRRGDLDGAEEAFELAHRLGHEPQPGIALLRLARGQVGAARASIGTALADAQDPFERARLLPARVEIALAAHDVAEAREAAEELRGIATTFESSTLLAAARLALGFVLIGEERSVEAIAELRAAVRNWTEADAPFETAVARRCLAVAYRSADDEASALLELRAAKEAFERIGAAAAASRCEELILAGQERDAGRRVLRTFMFTDIVGSTNLVETIGDEAWEDVVRWHDETLRTLIEQHGGGVVHTAGDGFFAAFPDASAGATCAVAIQRRLAEHRRKHGFAPRVRIGLHATEATVIADDYAGLGVHEAARVGALADGDEILVTVSTAAAEGFPFPVTGEREVALKGIARPVRIAAVDWRAS
jgi:class 3 adenylate cyclase